TDPAGGVTRYAYDAAGRILTMTDVRGIVMAQNEYGITPDGQVRLLRQEQADGGVWQFTYFIRCNPFIAGCVAASHEGTRVIDPRGYATHLHVYSRRLHPPEHGCPRPDHTVCTGFRGPSCEYHQSPWPHSAICV